jgi:hypothetical protein
MDGSPCGLSLASHGARELLAPLAEGRQSATEDVPNAATRLLPRRRVEGPASSSHVRSYLRVNFSHFSIHQVELLDEGGRVCRGGGAG